MWYKDTQLCQNKYNQSQAYMCITIGMWIHKNISTLKTNKKKSDKKLPSLQTKNSHPPNIFITTNLSIFKLNIQYFQINQ
jgi:hypothetical protein